MESSEPLRPPRTPATLEEFLLQVNENREAWYNYICEVSNQNTYLQNENTSLREQTIELQGKEASARSEISES
jgi:hypothetical protein